MSAKHPLLDRDDSAEERDHDYRHDGCDMSDPYHTTIHVMSLRRKIVRNAARYSKMIFLSFAAAFTAFTIFRPKDAPFKVKAQDIAQGPFNFTGPHRSVLLNSTLGFQKIFVINTEARTDKRAEMTILSKLYNIDLTFVPGVKGIDVVKLDEKESLAYPRLQNEIGCARAHTNVWQKMIEEDIASALIFEDDVDFDVNIRKQLDKFQEPFTAFLAADKKRDLYVSRKDPWNTPNWDLLWTGTCKESPWKDNRKSEYLTYSDATNLGPGPIFHRNSVWDMFTALNLTYPENDALSYLRPRVIQKVNLGMCTQSYALTNKGAMKILYEVSHRDWREIDNLMAQIAREGFLDGYIVVPPFFSQFAHSYIHRDSDITEIEHSKWRQARLPGPEGTSQSVKDSAKASLRSILAGM